MVFINIPSDGRKPLIMVCGMYGSGKTTAAKSLQKHLPAYDRIGIDETRQGMGLHVYRREDTPRVLERLCIDVERSLASGLGVIIDRPHQTRPSRMLSYEAGITHSRLLVLVETVCPESTARSRIAARVPVPGEHSPSNDPSVYDRIKQRWEDIPPDFDALPFLAPIASYIRFDTADLKADLVRVAPEMLAFSRALGGMLEDGGN